jgi:hypothetical protein
MENKFTLEFTKANLLELLQGCSSLHFNSILNIEIIKDNEVFGYVEGTRKEMIDLVKSLNFSTFDITFNLISK